MTDCIRIDKLNGKDVKDLISVRYVITVDKNKPSLNEVLFYVRNGRLYSEAIEGGRLSVASVECDANDGVFFNIVAKDLVDVNKALKVKSEVAIVVDKDKDVVSFEIDGNSVDCEIVKSPTFISFNKLFTEEPRHKLGVSRDVLLPKLKELSKLPMPTKDTRVCVLSVKEGVLNLHLKGVDDVVMPIECSCDYEFEMYFNLKHLIDMLNSIKDKEITLEFKKETDPVVYKGINKKDMLYPLKF